MGENGKTFSACLAHLPAEPAQLSNPSRGPKLVARPNSPSAARSGSSHCQWGCRRRLTAKRGPPAVSPSPFFPEQTERARDRTGAHAAPHPRCYTFLHAKSREGKQIGSISNHPWPRGARGHARTLSAKRERERAGEGAEGIGAG